MTILTPAGTVFYIGTWAAMPAANAVPTYAQAWITDVGVGAYSVWVSDGTKWRLAMPQDLRVDLTAVVGTTGTTEQLFTGKAFTFPTGLLLALRYVYVLAVWTKSGATDAYTTFGFRLGSAGSVADASILAAGSSMFTTSGRSYAAEYLFAATGSTQVRKVGAQSPASTQLSNPSASSGTTSPQNVTVNDMSAGASILTPTATMAASTDSPGIAQLIVRGY